MMCDAYRDMIGLPGQLPPVLVLCISPAADAYELKTVNGAIDFL